jgi:8-oxo-dGTP pyrophosphatase MutT (NUDIX family)
MTVREDEIERDNGTRGIYGVVEKCDSAIVIAVDDDDVYLVEQFRYPVGMKTLEFPQGSLERNDLDPEAIAREELQAETGLVADSLECLGEIYIAWGVCEPEDLYLSCHRAEAVDRAARRGGTRPRRAQGERCALTATCPRERD